MEFVIREQCMLPGKSLISTQPGMGGEEGSGCVVEVAEGCDARGTGGLAARGPKRDRL